MNLVRTVSVSVPRPALVILLAGLSAAGSLHAATYHVDPATGSMSNPGTAAAPWSTLAAIFSANKVFAAGDEIILHGGYHGAPVVKGHNTAAVFIRPESAAVTPAVSKLTVKTGSYWDIAGLDISPEHASPVVYGGNLATLESTAHHITVRDCKMRSSAEDPFTWALADWSRAGKGFSVSAPYTSLIGNRLDITNFSILINKGATNSLVSGNEIHHFSMDAIRGLADHCVYEYNYVTSSYISDDNHDDFFQSWSTGPTGTVGAGTVYNVTLRGNVFISHTDAAQPLKKAPQGIGCFDGKFENWVVENNIISSKTYHGIALYGAINCTIFNNTVLENPISGSSSLKPWVKVYNHKNGTLSTGNVIRNNVSSAAAGMPTTAGVRDHNLTTTAYATYFTDYANFDFYPLPTSPVIGAGDATGAPVVDIAGNPRTAPIDVGAFEFVSELIVDNSSPTGFTSTGIWASSNSVAGYQGANYLHDDNAGKGTKTATFTAALGTGSYDVYVKYTSDGNRASNVPVTIRHAAGDTAVTVNQRINGGTWRLLGAYDFSTDSSGSVVISTTGTNGYVIADAVRFVRK